MKLCKRIIAAVLMTALLAVCIPAFGAPDYPEVPEGYDGWVTFSVSAIMMGWDYLVDPILVPVNEGDTVAVVTERAFGVLGVRCTHGGTVESGYYLSGVECYDTEPSVPEYIMHEMVDVYPGWAEENLGYTYGEWTGTFTDDGILSQTEYSTFSGWMYLDNNVSPSDGADAHTVTIGNSYTWIFTVYGWGMDYGINDGWGMFPAFDNPMEGVSRDAASTAYAQIGIDQSITDEMFDNAMDEMEAFITLFYDPTASQEELDDALAALIAALYGAGEFEPGDVNMDGEVGADDALLIMRHTMGISQLDEDALALADVNGDGEVTMEDALVVLRASMGIQ